jgi:uncharacterized protein YjbI with pentapeptide repeats
MRPDESDIQSKATLRGADLSEMNLAGKELEFVDFEDANLTNANFEDATLYGSNFAGANLTGANLKGANLGSSFLKRAKLRDVKVDSRTNFRGAVFDRGVIDGRSFDWRISNGLGFADPFDPNASIRDVTPKSEFGRLGIVRLFVEIIFRVRFRLNRLTHR